MHRPPAALPCKLAPDLHRTIWKFTDPTHKMLPPAAPVNERTSDSPKQANAHRAVHWITLLLLLAFGMALRLANLPRKPFWSDECFSVEIAWLDWRNFLHVMWWREANMSLYYMLLSAWLHFGHNEFFIRSLSVLMAVATLPAIYWVARMLYDRRVALITCVLFAFNAYSVRYAQEARSYSLFLLLATLSSGFLIAWVRQPSRRTQIGYILASILAVYAHFYALLLVAAHWVVFRWLGSPGSRTSEANRDGYAQLRRAWITIGLAVLPLLIFVAKTGAGPIRWVPRPGLHDVVEFFEHLAGGHNGALAGIYTVACIAGIAPLRKQLLARNQSWETWRCQFLLLWLLFPVLLTVVLSFARPVFLARYMIFCLPGLLILVAAGLLRIRQSWLLGATLTGILLLSLQGVFFVYGHDFDTERDAAGAATDFVLDQAHAGDAIIFYIPATRLPYEYFRSLRAGENTASPNFTAQLGPEILFPHHGAGLDYRDFTGKFSAELLHLAASSHPRLWVMLMNNQPVRGYDPTTAMLTQILPESFPRLQRWQFPRVEVRLYSKQ
jgi:mannosyltransferase